MDFLRKLPKMLPTQDKINFTVIVSLFVFTLWRGVARNYPTPKWYHKLEHLIGINNTRLYWSSNDLSERTYCVTCGKIDPPTNEKISQQMAEHITMSTVWANRPGKHSDRYIPEIELDRAPKEEQQMIIAEVNRQLHAKGYEDFGTDACSYSKQHSEVMQKKLNPNK